MKIQQLKLKLAVSQVFFFHIFPLCLNHRRILQQPCDFQNHFEK